MGVPGLWDLLRPAAARTSLSTLAYQAFRSNRNGRRALIIGVDAAIWIFHAQIPVHGENPFLRTIFYKITTLLQQPVLPVFVFDGPNKPPRKRNQNVAGQFGTADHRSKQFKALLDVCGLEWWNAPGEAEAELAIMNRQGKIDAVLSDDGDALLFGATCLLRNNSPTLSGAQASSNQHNSSKADQRHYEVYRSSAIRELWGKKEGTKLESEEDDRLAMTLIALLAGGDYAPEGFPSLGPTIAFGLANAGHASFLKSYISNSATFTSHLPKTQSEIIAELRTNSSKQVGRKYPERASKLSAIAAQDLFPQHALKAYLQPATSPPQDKTQGWPGFDIGSASRGRGKARNGGKGEIEGMAKACETYFEWGTRDLVVKKFMGEGVGLFGVEVMNEARELVLRRDKEVERVEEVSNDQAGSSRITSFFAQSRSSTSVFKSGSQPQTTGQNSSSDHPAHIAKIHSTRKDPTNPDLTEYRISFRPEGYVSRCHKAMDGTRVDPKNLPLAERQALGLVERASPEDEDDVLSSTQVAPGSLAGKSEIRTWIPEYLVREAWPGLVTAYDEGIKTRLNRSPKKKQAVGKGIKKSGKGKNVDGEDVNRFKAFFKQGASSHLSEEEIVEQVEYPVAGKKSSRSKVKDVFSKGISTRSRSRSQSVIDLSLSPSPSRQLSPSDRISSPSALIPEGRKKNSRPCLSSSISSSGTMGSGSPTPKFPPTSSTSLNPPSSPSRVSNRIRNRKSVAVGSGSPFKQFSPERRRGSRLASASASASKQDTNLCKGGKDDPIILSSDEEGTPRPSKSVKSVDKPSSPLTLPSSTITLSNSPTPSFPSFETTGSTSRRRSLSNKESSLSIVKNTKPQRKGQRCDDKSSSQNVEKYDPETIQQLLGFPIVVRSDPGLSSTIKPKGKERKKELKGVVVKSNDEVEYTDLTGTGVWKGIFRNG